MSWSKSTAETFLNDELEDIKTVNNTNHSNTKMPTRDRSFYSEGQINKEIKILIVDDDPTVRRSLVRILERKWPVDSACDASVAAKMLETGQYSAVITDYAMPGENGIWLLEQLMQRFPTTKRVLSSGNSVDCFETQISSGLVHCFLPKPLTLNGIEQVLQ